MSERERERRRRRDKATIVLNQWSCEGECITSSVCLDEREIRKETASERERWIREETARESKRQLDWVRYCKCE